MVARIGPTSQFIYDELALRGLHLIHGIEEVIGWGIVAQMMIFGAVVLRCTTGCLTGLSVAKWLEKYAKWGLSAGGEAI